MLPIDQLREYTGPVGLITKRIPRSFLEAVYGIHIDIRPLEEGGTGVPTASEFLSAYAKARGFQTQGVGQPDESRAARVVLKDYVSGKLLYVEPPPGYGDAADFNRELYDSAHLPPKRRAAVLAALGHRLHLIDDDNFGNDDDHSHDNETASTAASSSDLGSLPPGSLPPGAKSQRLDKAFFSSTGRGNAGHLSMPFNHKYTQHGRDQAQTRAKNLSGRKARAMVALETGLDPSEVKIGGSKKHFKGGPKGKEKKGDSASTQ